MGVGCGDNVARRSQPSVRSLLLGPDPCRSQAGSHTHLAPLPHTAASRCPKGESPSLLAAWALGRAPARDQDRPPGVLKALNQRSALQGWAVSPPSQYGRHRWVAANSWPFSLVLLPPARREDPRAVQGPGAQVGVLRPWGVAHLLWEARGAGLPHRWPLSSSSSPPHPAGSREQAERQPATDTVLQRAKKDKERLGEGRASPRRGPRSIARDGQQREAKAASGGLLTTTLPEAGPPQRAEESHGALNVSVSVSVSLSPSDWERSLGKV